MRNIKSFILALACFCLTLTVLASSGTVLCVQLHSGKIDKFVLVEKPVVSFDGQYVSIKSSVMNADSAYKYVDVEKFYFDVVQDEIIVPDTIPDPGPIDEVERINENQNTTFEFAYDGRYAQIKGLGAKSQVAVFSVDGKRMQPKTVATSTAVTISMYELPTGIYIIRAGDKSIKIIRK